MRLAPVSPAMITATRAAVSIGILQLEGGPIVGAGGAAGKRTPAGAGRSGGCGYAFWRWYTWIRWRLASTTNSLSWASRRTETGPQK